MNESTSILTSAWTEVTTSITNIMGVPAAALTLTLPLVGLAIGVARRLFVRKGR